MPVGDPTNEILNDLPPRRDAGRAGDAGADQHRVRARIGVDGKDQRGDGVDHAAMLLRETDHRTPAESSHIGALPGSGGENQLGNLLDITWLDLASTHDLVGDQCLPDSCRHVGSAALASEALQQIVGEGIGENAGAVGGDDGDQGSGGTVPARWALGSSASAGSNQVVSEWTPAPEDHARRSQWQNPVPESVKLCPAMGRNRQS